MIRQVEQALYRQGYPTLLHKEPGGTTLGAGLPAVPPASSHQSGRGTATSFGTAPERGARKTLTMTRSEVAGMRYLDATEKREGDTGLHDPGGERLGLRLAAARERFNGVLARAAPSH